MRIPKEIAEQKLKNLFEIGIMDSQQKSIVRQTRSMTRAAAEKAKSNLQSNRVVCGTEKTHDTPFEATFIDAEAGEEYDCAGCKRTNNAELYMVQCKDCDRWYHFSCGKVTTATVHATSFSCTHCVPRILTSQPHSFVSRSSGSSARKAQIERELERLEEEKRLMDEVEKEQLAQAHALLQKARLEKIERTKQYIAKKYDLRSQQDEQEGSTSAHSFRSNRMSKSRVEDWIQTQREVVDRTGRGIVENISELLTADSILPSVANPVERLDENFTSTPLAEEARAINVQSPVAVINPTDESNKSAVRKPRSTNLGQNWKANADAGIDDKSDFSISPAIPPVNMQPLLAMLDEVRAGPSTQGAIPKNDEVAVSYERWKQQRTNRELELAEKVRV